MRIAFDVSYIQKNRAGIGRHALQLIKALLQVDRHNEYVLHGWSLGLDGDLISRLQTHNSHLSTARIPGDVKRLYWNRLRTPSIETFVGNVQIFHSTDPFLPPTKKAKAISTVHDLAYKRLPEMFEPRVPSWDKYVERSTRLADAIIVPSQLTKSDLIEMFQVSAERVHIVQPPVNECFSSTKNISENEIVKQKFNLIKPYILFVGTFEPRKNIPAIVKAFEQVQKDCRPDVDLVLVGKQGWLYDETLRTINSSQVKSRIHYLEYVSDNELWSLYRQALCFVYPSLYEGYGFPILEAMASGVPIITSNSSSLRELADGVALLVDPRSIQDIAEAMNMLITNEVRRVEMRQRGLHIIQQFTAEAAAKKVLDIYTSLAS
ncbi:MAG: glycosyltransferase family 1 protein [Bacteroidota bacterium]